LVSLNLSFFQFFVFSAFGKDKLKFYRLISNLRKEAKCVNPVQVFAVENLPLIKKGDNLGKLIVEAAKKQNNPIMQKDVIVVTHVVVSKAEGNIINLDQITPSQRAKEIAQKTNKDPALVEVVLQETKDIVRIGQNSIITETVAA
jgi:coenzyme F420-0:L-glutamate ligase/coenzyme F420-1:gamma-L-glutamate ligase